MPKEKGKLPKSLSVDFTGVESGGGRGAHVPEGDYLVQVVDVRRKQTKDDASRFYLNWKLKILEPKKYAGKLIYHITALGEESLWSLRNFLVDLLGEDSVPQKKVDIPLAKIVKKQPKIGITTEDDEWQGKKKSNVAGTFPKADWSELGKAAAAEDEDEEEDEEEEEETEDEEDEDEEEDEEEEEEKPKKKSKKVKKEKGKKKAKKPELDDDDDEEDMDEIDVDDI